MHLNLSQSVFLLTLLCSQILKKISNSFSIRWIPIQLTAKDTKNSWTSYRWIIKVRLTGNLLDVIQSELVCRIANRNWRFKIIHRTSDRLREEKKQQPINRAKNKKTKQHTSVITSIVRQKQDPQIFIYQLHRKFYRLQAFIRRLRKTPANA